MVALTSLEDVQPNLHFSRGRIGKGNRHAPLDTRRLTLTVQSRLSAVAPADAVLSIVLGGEADANRPASLVVVEEVVQSVQSTRAAW